MQTKRQPYMMIYRFNPPWLHVDDNADSFDDGIQFTELGEGSIGGYLNKVTVSGSSKYGIKAEQWITEDEDESMEPSGFLKTKNITLVNNGKGNDIKAHNISVK
ncbi:hypothetical protein [Alkalimarinus alittae]|uniref:Uncharacterized protein n=1 Tax=Alkalimarinus alittae TaxID=2961619 RepID=A0ABY6MYU2_9ALTE|nr:hypothetical protein [Alkalimarinus alittae]UZE95022.1 hypothetical protein NKI27_13210 [Alkalimarinus alittae]